jgi:hypothetical protein
MEKQGKVWLVHACGMDKCRLLAANGAVAEQSRLSHIDGSE